MYLKYTRYFLCQLFFSTFVLLFFGQNVEYNQNKINESDKCDEYSLIFYIHFYLYKNKESILKACVLIYTFQKNSLFFQTYLFVYIFQNFSNLNLKDVKDLQKQQESLEILNIFSFLKYNFNPYLCKWCKQWMISNTMFTVNYCII